MTAAITTPDATLTNSINQAQTGIGKAAEGGKGVLDSEVSYCSLSFPLLDCELTEPYRPSPSPMSA